jgi:flagellar biosynthesis/type III secretory pathway M-ring protein FliF/YscJ
MVQAGGGSDGTMDIIRGYGPQAGLGFLALLSMTMMLRIVRKSAEHVGSSLRPKAVHIPPGEEELLTAGPDPVGKAGASESLLVGREVDDDSLRYAELSEEVSKLVREDAPGAAAMLRRWAENMD